MGSGSTPTTAAFGRPDAPVPAFAARERSCDAHPYRTGPRDAPDGNKLAFAEFMSLARKITNPKALRFDSMLRHEWPQMLVVNGCWASLVAVRQWQIAASADTVRHVAGNQNRDRMERQGIDVRCISKLQPLVITRGSEWQIGRTSRNQSEPRQNGAAKHWRAAHFETPAARYHSRF